LFDQFDWKTRQNWNWSVSLVNCGVSWLSEDFHCRKCCKCIFEVIEIPVIWHFPTQLHLKIQSFIILLSRVIAKNVLTRRSWMSGYLWKNSWKTMTSFHIQEFSFIVFFFDSGLSHFLMPNKNRLYLILFANQIK
jgi:hypothetical protein